MEPRVLRSHALGLRPHELIALKSVCRLSQQPGRRFAHEVAAPDQPAQLIVVATDDPASLAQWRAHDPQVRIPFIAVGPMPEGSEHGVNLPRPFLASRLLIALDACAEELVGMMGLGGPREQAASDTEPAAQAAQAAPSAQMPPRRGRSILLVDDSAIARKQIELELLGMQLTAHSVVSGEEALRAIDRYHFDLILLDVVLPGTDGYQVCKAIKKNPRTRNIPVVMLTSKTSQFDKIRGKFAGCDTYLTKPLSRAGFAAAVKEWLAPIALDDSADAAANAAPESIR